jgi:hypothetical protein
MESRSCRTVALHRRCADRGSRLIRRRNDVLCCVASRFGYVLATPAGGPGGRRRSRMSASGTRGFGVTEPFVNPSGVVSRPCPVGLLLARNDGVPGSSPGRRLQRKPRSGGVFRFQALGARADGQPNAGSGAPPTCFAATPSAETVRPSARHRRRRPVWMIAGPSVSLPEHRCAKAARLVELNLP